MFTLRLICHLVILQSHYFHKNIEFIVQIKNNQRIQSHGSEMCLGLKEEITKQSIPADTKSTQELFEM